MDIVEESKRSYIMSMVPHKETKQELLVAKFLYSNGFRYRKNYKNLPGKPDLALTKLKVVIFVNGCFWHGHQNCKYSKTPSTNIEYWNKKIVENQHRDQRNIESIKELGWRSIILWQCELKNKSRQEAKLISLLSELINIKNNLA
ncbi:MAG: very short patch repair endonuclease [Methanosarcina sp.]